MRRFWAKVICRTNFAISYDKLRIHSIANGIYIAIGDWDPIKVRNSDSPLLSPNVETIAIQDVAILFQKWNIISLLWRINFLLSMYLHYNWDKWYDIYQKKSYSSENNTADNETIIPSKNPVKFNSKECQNQDKQNNTSNDHGKNGIRDTVKSYSISIWNFLPQGFKEIWNANKEMDVSYHNHEWQEISSNFDAGGSKG